MPRKSSAKATGQSLSFSQTLIDEYNSGIQARVVHEKDLETEHIQWLLGPDDANSPRSVGVSPAYSRTGRLPALACALDSRVLIINFHTTDPYRDGDVSRSASATLSRRRNQLEEELFCHPHCTLYAFDLAPLALSLRLHFNIHLTNAIDIQSALQVSGRSVVAAVQIVISDPSLVFSDNISSAFENMFYESNKDKDLTELVQRAWLTSYVGRYDVEEIQDLFSKAPKVDMKKFSDAELNILQKMAYDTLRQDNLKPQSTTHEIKTTWDPKKQKMVAISQRYANRLTVNASRVKVTLAHSSSASYSLPADASNVRGKSALIEVEHNLEGKDIAFITSIGKDGPTRAELDRGDAVLLVLQGALPLFENNWMKAIWMPSEPVNWPESFSSPPDPPTPEIIEHPDAPLNASQHEALTKMFSPESHITLVQGPPGTGKTTVIANYVISAIKANQRGIWLMAQSNVAVKNIAEKLVKLEFFDFKLLVSQDFHFEWHEHLYEKVQKNMIVSSRLPKSTGLKKFLQGSQVILCTLSMISNPKLQDLTRFVPVMSVIIDEASQIEVGQYIPLFKSFGETLRNLCFIGDDKQLPPHGQDDLGNLQSIFELEHLRESLSFLDTQCLYQIGDFISQHVYGGQLKSYSGHPVNSSTVACRFVDVNGLEQRDDDGKSCFNQKEVDAIVPIAYHLQEEDIPYRIITPYDAQRNKLEKALQSRGLNWHDKCFNVDAFQGNEDHVIIISVVRSQALGFLANLRRTNVMLTRCQRSMYIVSSRAFLEGRGADSLVGRMAAELGQRPGAWLTLRDIENRKFE